MEQAEIVSNMLRWLLRFSEYEDPPTQDILAGYELDSRLLHSIIERNNTAMVAWGAKQPYNSLACDLLKAVEIFADDSNFKAQVIDSSAEALATVLKVPALALFSLALARALARPSSLSCIALTSPSIALPDGCQRVISFRFFSFRQWSSIMVLREGRWSGTAERKSVSRLRLWFEAMLPDITWQEGRRIMRRHVLTL